ncbi:nuclear transport factor 2 family protein [Phytohabitans aurantiacus]|jgi:steroid delta-isomerase|uniref:Ketosteroid isomerase n=1 Tax=Phytohabitans aurantiacus TaxID=3016789 RepID=A0ABQ5R3V7_9ACTN|nr:nuclear transport factor 2 family protein [Phytohabitans aurantiacus]GLI01474.1 ketosteroid isomerase [Phytohabitans aurantiacus]
MIASDAVIWNAPDDPHPARAAAQRSYSAVARGDLDGWLSVYAEDAILEDPVGPSMFDPEGKGHHGHEGLSAFWKSAIAPVARFEFTITDSFANPGSDTCANIGTIKAILADGSHATTHLIMVYVVDRDGLVTSMKAYWEPNRTMASFRPA